MQHKVTLENFKIPIINEKILTSVSGIVPGESKKSLSAVTKIYCDNDTRRKNSLTTFRVNKNSKLIMSTTILQDAINKYNSII